jgi:hypothetical protein
MLTAADLLFEQFCAEHGIECRRIPENEQKTPDYEIQLAGAGVAVEVKQLEPNADDLRHLEELRNGRTSARSVDMGRARQSIVEAAKQLRAYAKGRLATIVVLFDTMGIGSVYLDPYSLAYCLYGPERVHFAVPNDPTVEPWVLGSSLGGGRAFTPSHNTTVSSVAVLQRYGPELCTALSVFHNIYAAVPLDPMRLRGERIEHFSWLAAEPSLLPTWRAI